MHTQNNGIKYGKNLLMTSHAEHLQHAMSRKPIRANSFEELAPLCRRAIYFASKIKPQEVNNRVLKKLGEINSI